MRILKSFAVIGLLVGMLSACASSYDKLMDSGAEAFTKQELTFALTGMTVIWSEGGGYYAEDGTLDTLWDGVRETGTYEFTDAGEVCWTVESWGETTCETYYHQVDGETSKAVTVYEGKVQDANEIKFGNKLDEMAEM